MKILRKIITFIFGVLLELIKKISLNKIYLLYRYLKIINSKNKQTSKNKTSSSVLFSFQVLYIYLKFLELFFAFNTLSIVKCYVIFC